MHSQTWIIFHAEPRQPGWETRKLPMGGLTDILDEHWDYTKKGNVPQPGARLTQFLQIDEFVEPDHPQTPTHTRLGDWIVTRVERYPASSPECSKHEIVVCYCKYDPVESEPQLIGRIDTSESGELQKLLLS